MTDIIIKTKVRTVPEFYLKECFPQANELEDNRLKGTVRIKLIPSKNYT